MTPPPNARDRLRQRAARIRRIRRRVAATTLAAIALTFGVIAAQGSTGAQTATTTASTRAAATSTPAPTTTTATPTPAPVTTSQS
jgi:hypothetical protein